VPDEASLDDLSRLWMMFPESSYTLSVLYVASVVLIEAVDEAPAPGLPVQSVNLAVVPLALPVIDSVEPQIVEGVSPAVTLNGRNLLAATAAQTTVSIDNAAAIAVQPSSTAIAVSFAVPPGLAAGVHGVQVVRADPLGAPHVGSASNPAFFALRPRLTSTTLSGGNVTAVLAPQPGAAQRIVLLLNGISVPVPRSFALNAQPRTADTDPVVFPAAALATGTTYLTRVQVDSVESSVLVDAAGHIAGPMLNVP